jgi:hypothetical protein
MKLHCVGLALSLIASFGGCQDATRKDGLPTGTGAAQAAESPPAAPVLAEALDETGPDGPTTTYEAAKFLDLESFPLAPGAEESVNRCLAQQTYRTTAPTDEAFKFLRAELAKRGWKELSGGYLSKESMSAPFTRAGFTVDASASELSEGQTMVSIFNRGNVPLSKLPVPDGCTKDYEFPSSVMYTAPGAVEETAKQVAELLQADGWSPYGGAGDSKYFKKNAIQASANVMAAPAKQGKTVIQWSTVLLSADLPAPADAKDIRFSQPPVQLMVDFKGNPAAADAWYREAMMKLGWTPTTDHPVSESEVESWVIYRNKPGEMAEIKFRKVDDFTRLTIEFTSAQEMVAMEKRWEEEKKKLEAAKRSENGNK